MKNILILVGTMILLQSSLASARDCAKIAGSAAKAVDAISNGTSTKAITVRSAKKIGEVRSGGETLDTYEVYLTVNEDMSAIYEVKLHSSACVIESVRFVTGD